jgi:uncharacterized transporter YbjL
LSAAKYEPGAKRLQNLHKFTQMAAISTTGYIKGALTLISALAVNTAVKDIINVYYPKPADSAKFQVIYAITIILCILLIIWGYNTAHIKYEQYKEARDLKNAFASAKNNNKHTLNTYNWNVSNFASH